MTLTRLFIFSIMASILSACGGRSATTGAVMEGNSSHPAVAQPTQESFKIYTYEVVNVIPHSTGSYTQGLYWDEGHFWEGTGEYGKSALLKTDPKNGNIIQRIDLPEKYFGEGIARLGDEIFQLTWLEKTAIVYDAQSLEKKKEFRYDGEGWGLTSDGERLYMSNGSHEISVIDPSSFRVEKKVPVTLGNRNIKYLNELEWIEGKIWANVYTSDEIVIFDPVSGKVEGVVDLSGILPARDRGPQTDVLNGIAYDSENGRIFVTGKNWNKLFEIRIVERESRRI